MRLTLGAHGFAAVDEEHRVPFLALGANGVVLLAAAAHVEFPRLADGAVGADPVRRFGRRRRLILPLVALGDVGANRVAKIRARSRHEDELVIRAGVDGRAVGAIMALPPHPVMVGVAGEVGVVVAPWPLVLSDSRQCQR